METSEKIRRIRMIRRMRMGLEYLKIKSSLRDKNGYLDKNHLQDPDYWERQVRLMEDQIHLNIELWKQLK